MNDIPRRQKWRKMKKRQTAETENLLRSNERWCMNACSRFSGLKTSKGKVWTLTGNSGKITAFIVHVRYSLLPVLCGVTDIPPPDFLRGFFTNALIHSYQGRKNDILILETALEKIGLSAPEKIDYDLMCIDRPPSDYLAAGPSGLVIRKPSADDLDGLAALHAGYEKEEVLPESSEFSAAASRLNTERILKREQILVAELDGRLIGKINTNAVTFTRYQIGGVYVHPDYRSLGVARRMIGIFTADLVSRGRGVSLFVKKSNPGARSVYRRVGFEILGDYRIGYF